MGENKALDRSRTTERTAKTADAALVSASLSEPIPETGINLARVHFSSISSHLFPSGCIKVPPAHDMHDLRRSESEFRRAGPPS